MSAGPGGLHAGTTGKPLALSGVRVIDLTELLPGPYATQVLADMGAEVIKIERPRTGDNGRTIRPGTFEMFNRGKKSVALNLKEERGREILLRLADQADILIEGYRPGVVARLGIEFSKVNARNPRIVYASISGFGQTGPLRDQPGHDLNYNAVAGVVALCGSPDRPPEHVVGVPLADLSGSLYAVTSILAALMLRARTGAGQYLDIALTDTALSLVGPRLGAYQDTKGFDRADLLRRPGNAVYETADGRYIAVGAIEDHFWSRLVAAMDLPELDDPRFEKARERWRHADAINPVLQARFRTKTHAEWLRLLGSSDVPATLVSDLDGLFDHPHFAARGMFKSGRNIRYVNYPVSMDGVDTERLSPAPQLGEHTDDVLRSFGWQPDEIEQLRRDSVVQSLSRP